MTMPYSIDIVKNKSKSEFVLGDSYSQISYIVSFIHASKSCNIYTYIYNWLHESSFTLYIHFPWFKFTKNRIFKIIKILKGVSYFLYFGLFGATPNYAQGLLLGLSLGITCSGLEGNQYRVTCIQYKHLNCCFIWPIILLFIYFAFWTTTQGAISGGPSGTI